METIQYNERTTLGFEYTPIYASANPITGTRYTTTVYLITSTGRYPLGELNGKCDEEEIKASFKETLEQEQARQYGTQRSLLRRELQPRRDRGKVGTLGQQLHHSTMRGRSILNDS